MKITLLIVALASFNAFGQSTLSFDGVDDYVDLGTTIGDNVRTIEMWFSPTTTIDGTQPDYITLIAKEVDLINNGDFSMSFMGNTAPNPGALMFLIAVTQGNNKYVVSDATSWNAGQWYHVAAVMDPVQGMLLFIDGIKQADTTGYYGATPVVTANTELGRQGTMRYFNGMMDDVRISSAPMYTSNFTPPCPDITPGVGTMAVYNLNANTGTTAGDASGNGFDGTIFGATWSAPFVCSASIFELEGELLDLYPNPTNGEVIIDLSNLNGEIEDVELTNAYGQKVTIEVQKNKLDLSGFADGVYIVRLVAGGQLYSSRIVKQ